MINQRGGSFCLSVFCVFFQAGWVLAGEEIVQYSELWTVKMTYIKMREKPIFESANQNKINVGNVSYLSSSSGRVEFEARQEGALLAVELPRQGLLSWGIFGGPLSYEVDLPSGAVTNSLQRAHGFAAGMSIALDLVRRTLVTPQVEVKWSWQINRVQFGRIHLGGSGATPAIENRFDVHKMSMGFTTTQQRGNFTSRGGVELFQKAANLKDLTGTESVEGKTRGYGFFAGLLWNLSTHETLGFDAIFGDERGYALRLTQSF